MSHSHKEPFVDISLLIALFLIALLTFSTLALADGNSSGSNYQNQTYPSENSTPPSNNQFRVIGPALRFLPNQCTALYKRQTNYYYCNGTYYIIYFNGFYMLYVPIDSLDV